MPEKGRDVIGCGIVNGSSLALAANGKVFESFVEDYGGRIFVSSWDGSGTWKLIAAGLGSRTGPALRTDSQGRVVLAYATDKTESISAPFVQRWDGTRWESLAEQFPTTIERAGSNGVDLAIDALDRPVLLLNSYSADFTQVGTTLTVHRLESGTWVQLGGAAQINSARADSTSGTTRLTLDSADGVTPYVVYRPVGPDHPRIAVVRLTATGWSELPPLVRQVNGGSGIDLAVVGGQAFLAYLDGGTDGDRRPYVSQGDASGWSTGTQVNIDTDRPAAWPRILATGPSPENLILAYLEWDAAAGLFRTFFKRGPTWTPLPGDVSQIAGPELRALAVAVDPSRIAMVWTNFQDHILRYHEIAR